MTLIFSYSVGLNTKLDPVREKYNPNTGVTKLSEAVNIDVDESGRAGSMGFGYSSIISGEYHSLCPFDCGGYMLVAKDTSLYAVDPDGNEMVVKSGLTPFARLDYAKAHDGVRDVVFYVNGYERGCVSDRVHYPWNVTAYVGPDTDEVHEDPPSGAHLICLYNGRIYLAVDNCIYGSVHHDFYKFIYLANGMMFPGRISMMRPVVDGLYVSAGNQTIFLPGQDMSPVGNWEPFGFRKVLNSYIVLGAHDYIDSQNVGLDVGTEGILCYGPEGIFFAGPGGGLFNITSKNLSSRKGSNYLPDGLHGAGMVFDNERFVLTVEP